MRIRGSIGQWPVDLNIELDESDWASLAGLLGKAPPAEAPARPAAPAAARPANQDDRLWQAACELLREAGQLSGPELAGRLEDLTGSESAAKRLLVRLRHNASVKVQSGADAPLYSWVG